MLKIYLILFQDLLNYLNRISPKNTNNAKLKKGVLERKRKVKVKQMEREREQEKEKKGKIIQIDLKSRLDSNQQEIEGV